MDDGVWIQATQLSVNLPRISVVVLNWNGRTFLDPCLRSLAAQTYPDAELIVVDNGSHDGSVHFVRSAWPNVRLLALSRNRGFAGGVNAGLYVARGEYIVLLNNDAIADPTLLAELIAPLEHDTTLAATAGVLTFAHQPQLIASAGVRMFRDGVALDDRLLQPVAALPANPVPVFGPSGGAACYRRTALHDVGVFDEGYFAYLEDVDLAWRLRLRGWATLLAPAAQAAHIYSATGGEGSPFKDWLIARNRWRVLLRCWPTALLVQHWPSILAYDALALGQAALRRRWTTITGRLATVRATPELLAQRRAIQARRSTDVADLERWLAPARSPGAIWRDMKRLAHVLQQRS